MKKLRNLVLISILFVILYATFASAQVNINQAMKPFWDLIKYFFVTLPGDRTFKYAYFKFLLFLILGAALLILMRNAPFLQKADDTAKKRGDLLAWFFALAGVVAIPQKALEFMFNEFGMFSTILLGVALPTLLFIAFANNDTKARGWAMLIGGVLLGVFGGMFAKGTPGAGWLVIAGVISGIIGIIMIAGASTRLGWFPTSGAATPPKPAAPPGTPGATPAGTPGAAPTGTTPPPATLGGGPTFQQINQALDQLDLNGRMQVAQHLNDLMSNLQP